MEKLIGILRFALAREVEGREFYKEKSQKVKSKDVKDTFESLYQMEEEHVKFIANLMEKLQKDVEINIDAELVKTDFFDNREKTELMPGTLEDMANDLSILRMAYLIEEDFENFYKMSAEKVENEEMKKLLNTLAKWEEGHKKALLELYEETMKTYWDKQGFTPLF
ncbi:MAG: ferritin-like domain-containing protein [Fervidobacterium sp.]